ncbi:MAG: aminopeptidase N [Acidiferrobacterales bacterium]|nr:aminopeptidase N [Acidiferrobacterales bacterium]
MKDKQDVIYLKDYQPHTHKISHSDLQFALHGTATEVTATHSVVRQIDRPESSTLTLDCERMDILSIEINGARLPASQYQQSEKTLSIFDTPNTFTLRIVNQINPSENTELSGLYQSSTMLCTQCEAEGFRRITPAIDRPDNLSTYRVTLRGDVAQFPVMLSNGNLENSEVNGSKQTVIWHDPFPKPTYLFAIVAGSLSEMRSSFRTSSNREVDLKFYASDADIEKCEYAMEALKRSMKWDEEVYGREYDLDLFNVVAVGDFNMGAMENKSLNIFNTKYVLADSDTATDTDFLNVERVVAHEYFHNWSGNRVTCRDWFQLSLKEGFTVFRDQEFSADMNSRGVQRISDVNVLRNHQFPEDAGPMAHPVRPSYYQEINNFYTVTIYEKGAEVVRMLRTLVGEEKFRAGTDLYFDRHDGQAVTTDDFVAAISDASGENLTQFQRWYSQAGTPRVEATYEYLPESKIFRIILKQSCPDTPDGEAKEPFVIPIKVSLFSQSGQKYPLHHNESEVTLRLEKNVQTVEFSEIESQPVPSVLREFTSPVILKHDLDLASAKVLFLHDDDPFNRWEAGQELYQRAIIENVGRLQNGKPCKFDPTLIEIVGKIIDDTISAAINKDGIDTSVDLALTAKLLSLPGQAWLAQQSKPIDPHAIAASHHSLSEKLADSHYTSLKKLYQILSELNEGGLSQQQMSIRELRDAVLKLLTALDVREVHKMAEVQLRDAKNMTDRASAFDSIVNSTNPNRKQLIDGFYQQWKQYPLVVDKWFRAQATSRLPNTLSQVMELSSHEAFDALNPNKVYSLIMGATHGNPTAFHQRDGEGYRFLASWVLKMDQTNPQIAARLASGFNQWQDMKSDIADAMRQSLISIRQQSALSSNVSEIVERALDE